MRNEVLKVLTNRIQHHSLHNEEGKIIRLDELKVLELIFKDRLKCV